MADSDKMNNTLLAADNVKAQVPNPTEKSASSSLTTSESNQNTVSSSRYNPEAANQYSEYLREANKDNPDYFKRPQTVYDLVKQIHPEPELDERKIKQANLRKKVGVIADSLRSIIDMGVTAGGGDVYARQKDNYVDEANKEIDKEQDRFTTALKNYQDLKKDALLYDREHPAKSQYEKDMEAARDKFFDKVGSSTTTTSKDSGTFKASDNSRELALKAANDVYKASAKASGTKGDEMTLSAYQSGTNNLVPVAKIPKERIKDFRQNAMAILYKDESVRDRINNYVINDDTGLFAKYKKDGLNEKNIGSLNDSQKDILIQTFWRGSREMLNYLNNSGYLTNNIRWTGGNNSSASQSVPSGARDLDDKFETGWK